MGEGRPRIIDNRFLIEAEAGHGGMGTVYRARDKHSGARVALKVLHRDARGSADRFSQEAALLAQLAHPGIVRYIDHGVTATAEHYLAMEWLEGETLEDRLARATLDVGEIGRLAARVLEALAVAHRKGVVHRDIKPSNLFLPAKELARVKLLDFGIARTLFDARRLTSSGATVGTPEYMSPEQARGATDLDARSDIFSLACVLVECAAGNPPFSGEADIAVLTKLCFEPPDLRGLRRCHPGFTALVTRMLAKDPAERPARAEALAGNFVALVAELERSGWTDAPKAGPDGARTPTPVILTGELRLVSAIVVLPAPGSGGFGEEDVAAARAAAQAFEARVDLFVGGMILVTLSGHGTPTDQAAQAARCALKLARSFPAARLAMSTGRTVVGDTLPLGRIVDRAALHLADQAAGTVVLDAGTAVLLEAGFELGTATGTHKQLLFEKTARAAPRTVLGKELPFVGRDRELRTLEALWDECVTEPAARAVLVIAAAGGGKSRVRHELLARLDKRGEGFACLMGGGDPLRAGSPFALLGPALRAAAGIAGDEPLAIQQERLLARVSRHTRPEAQKRVAAFLGEMTGVPFPDDQLPILHAARQDPRAMADQVRAAWLDWLEAEAAAHPVLIVLEDLHWGDLPSIEMVEGALRTLREKPILILALARPEIDEKFPKLWADRDLQRMALAPLTAKTCEKIIRQALGDAGTARMAWLIERADGNPFYLEELLRAVVEGVDVGADTAVPATVLGMVQVRFDALGSRAKRVLRAASIFGQTFRATGLRALVGDDDASLDEWLRILSEREIVAPRQGGDLRELTFRHALLRDAAYEMLTPEDRARGHRAAGEFLAEAGERDAIVLVEHFERGGEAARAARHCRTAAAQSLDANDLAAVIARVERGVRLGAGGEDLGALRVIEAQARFWRGEYVEAEGAARAAIDGTLGILQLQAFGELVASLGQQARFAEVEQCLEVARNRASPWRQGGAASALLLRAAGYLLPAGHVGKAEQLITEVEQTPGELEPKLRAEVQSLRAMVALGKGDKARSAEGYEAALELYRATGDLRAATTCLANLGTAVGDMGLLDMAEKHLGDALAGAERMNLQFVLPVVANLALVWAYHGRLDEARAAAEKARSLSRAQADRRFEGFATLCLAMVAHDAGRFPESEAHARAAMELLSEVPPLYPVAVAALSHALLAQGRFDEALAQAEEANRLLASLGYVEDCEALVRLSLVECRLGAGDREGARKALVGAHARLVERAAAIQKPEWREAFLANLPDHARTMVLARELGVEGVI